MTAMRTSRSTSQRSEVRLSIEEVTPERAQVLLGYNVNNRRIKKGAVARYVSDMRAGGWKDGAGEPVHVAPDGTLGNGQNRLLAIVEADVAVRLPFLYAPLDYRLVADQGARRTLSDVLTIEYQESGANLLAAMVRMVNEYRKTGEFGRRQGGPSTNAASIRELVETYLAEPNLKGSVGVYHREGDKRHYRRANIIPSVAATCHYLFNEKDPIEADVFFERLQRGTDLAEGSPILAARRWFAAEDHSGSQRVQAAVLIKAFNYWREGRTISRLGWRSGGSNPEPFPQINPPLDATEE